MIEIDAQCNFVEDYLKVEFSHIFFLNPPVSFIVDNPVYRI